MSQEKHEALVTRDAEDLLACAIAQETESILSTETASGTMSVFGHVSDSLYSGSPGHRPSLTTPKKTSTSSLKADVDSIGGWSDTLSVTLVTLPPSTESVSEEKKSLLQINGRGTDDRRPSSTISAAPSQSPRPSSRESRRSRRSRRRTSSQKSREPMTRGEVLMDLARHDSSKSHRRTQSSSSAKDNSVREKSSNSSRRQRKNSDTTTSSSSSGATQDGEIGPGGFARKSKRGYMTATEAVLLGDYICGCILKDKLMYFLKPIIFIFSGFILIAGGLALTTLHFVYEDSLVEKNPPYFTYGPITFSTGVILFMVGLVWIPIKQQKWNDGLASPMLAALSKWRLENLEKGVLEMKNINALGSPVEVQPVENMVTEVKEADG